MESTPSTPKGSQESLARFGKYEALEEIGIGGMATVYRARDTHLDRLVALKVLHPHLRGEGEARSRFAREAKSVARLEHENIVQVYDYAGEENEHAFLVVELLTGPTLAIFRKKTAALPAEIAAVMTLLVARALEAAHQEGIIHRDVKPENILLHKNETLKLTDFGIAQVKDTQGFTATGQILGSPNHMAPEQLEGKACDERSDLFSLGTVFYFLLAGRLPFEGSNPHQILKRIAEASFVDPRTYQPAIPEELVGIVRRLLARDPADRYEHAGALTAALDGLLAEWGIDEPEALLAEYFSAPAETAEALVEEMKAHHLERARAAIAAKERVRATASLEYLLALDPAHPEANELLHALSAGQDRRALLALAGLLVLGFAMVLFVFRLIDSPLPAGDRAIGAGTGAAIEEIESALAPAAEPGGGKLAHEAVPSDPPIESDAPTNAGTELSNAEAQEMTQEPRPIEAPTRPAESSRAPSTRSNPPARAALRQVRFSPIPQNVHISVNGSPARPFGPAFRQIDLEPGVHTFKLIDQSGCCEELEEEVRIPAGSGPYIYRPRLPFRPARLYLVSAIPAEAELRLASGRTIRARTREILSIPMESAEQSIIYTVTASDHRDYTGEIRVRAGQMTNTRVELLPSQPE